MNDTEAAWEELCRWESGGEGKRLWTMGCGLGYCVQPFLTLKEFDADDRVVRSAGATIESTRKGVEYDNSLAGIIRRGLAKWEATDGEGARAD